jgi:hypothetical protein
VGWRAGSYWAARDGEKVRALDWLAGDGFVDSIGDTLDMRIDTCIYTALEQ